jgi:hypothetical protein
MVGHNSDGYMFHPSPGILEVVVNSEWDMQFTHTPDSNNPLSTIIVDLANVGSKWIGGYTQASGGGPNLYVIGNGTFYNESTSVRGTTYIGVNVAGRGTINEFQGHSSGKLEFAKGVGAGQTVTDSGYELYGGEKGVVQIDQPGLYHAQTDLGFGEIILEGLKATSYSLKTDLLTLYRGNVAIDQVKLAFLATPVSLANDHGTGAPSNFGVSQVGGSVVIHADGFSYKDGGVLLAHHA